MNIFNLRNHDERMQIGLKRGDNLFYHMNKRYEHNYQ
jgi:hypothetical protein